jgi:hypothetical protein
MGTGGVSQSSLTAHFGLGTATVVDSLIVRWPWRDAQVVTNIPGNQRLTVVEGSGATAVEDHDPRTRPAQARLVLGPAVPNPFNPRTLIPYEMPAAGAARLAVYDVSGRLVRVLVESDRVGPGAHVAPWDGRDKEGRPVVSGVYYCRLEAVGQVRFSKLALLR